MGILPLLTLFLYLLSLFYFLVVEVNLIYKRAEEEVIRQKIRNKGLKKIWFFRRFSIFSLAFTSLIIYLRALKLHCVRIRISQSISSICSFYRSNPRNSGSVSLERVWKSSYLPNTAGNFEAGYPQSIPYKISIFFPLVMNVFWPMVAADVIPNVIHVHSKSNGMAS